MRLKDVDRLLASDASVKWVWVAGPMYVFEVNGSTPRYLLPVEELLAEHWAEDNGWWTCHPDTRKGDLAVMYRSGAVNEDGRLPRRGPKDLCQVMLATSDAFPLRDDPFAGEFIEHHG